MNNAERETGQPGQQGTSTADTGNGAEQVTLDQLKQDFARLRDDVSSVLRNQWKDARRRMTEGAAAGYDSARGAMGTARERGGQAMGSAREHIGQRPLIAVAIAFGAGLLAAKLMDRE